jgi:hypothetical protein
VIFFSHRRVVHHYIKKKGKKEPQNRHNYTYDSPKT